MTSWLVKFLLPSRLWRVSFPCKVKSTGWVVTANSEWSKVSGFGMLQGVAKSFTETGEYRNAGRDGYRKLRIIASIMVWLSLQTLMLYAYFVVAFSG